MAILHSDMTGVREQPVESHVSLKCFLLLSLSKELEYISV